MLFIFQPSTSVVSIVWNQFENTFNIVPCIPNWHLFSRCCVLDHTQKSFVYGFVSELICLAWKNQISPFIFILYKQLYINSKEPCLQVCERSKADLLSLKIYKG